MFGGGVVLCFVFVFLLRVCSKEIRVGEREREREREREQRTSALNVLEAPRKRSTQH